MAFRRRAFGRSRVTGTPRVPKGPKVKPPAKPKSKELTGAYKKLISGSRQARIQALYEAINWWDVAVKYFLSKKPMDANALSTYEKANKARVLGLDTGATEGEKEMALSRCLKLYEKIWAASNGVPEIDPYLQTLNQEQAKLEAKELALQARYTDTLDALNKSFEPLGMSFGVQKSDIARQLDGKRILLSQDLCKVLSNKGRSEGLLSVLFSEAVTAVKAAAVETDAEGRATLNIQKILSDIPVMFQSILTFCDSVPRSKVFRAAPETLEATVGASVASSKPRQPRDPNKPHTSQGPRRSGLRVGGRYLPGSAMAILYEQLQDQLAHPLSEILKGLAVGNPADRLKWLTRHGDETGKWKVTVSGNTVQMKMS